MPVIGAPGGAGSLLGVPVDGGYAVWDEASGQLQFVSASVVMRTSIDAPPGSMTGPGQPTIGAGIVPALDDLTDAGSYYLPRGIAPDHAPDGADISEQYVLAVTSSPSNELIAQVPLPAEPLLPGQPMYQAGIQILTLLTDPSRVWRRGFLASDPVTFTSWVLSGAAAAAPQSYRHVQSSAAAVWTVSHGLPFRPSVAVVDSTGRTVLPGEVDYLDDATVQLTFSSSLGGECYLS
jgi:hypothetical protein